MDGFKRRLNESVQLKLSLTLSLALLVVAMLAGIFSFISAFDEAHDLQDDVLRQIATLMVRQGLPAAPLAATPNAGPASGSDEESRVIVQNLTDGRSSSLSIDKGGMLPLPDTLPDGLHTLDAGGETFRVMVRTMTSGLRIAVAQEASFRNEIARDSALRTTMPFLILVPVLLIVLAHLVRTLFRPIAVLSAEINQRSEQALHPVDEDRVPIEVRPFVAAINRLLVRVAQSMETQRRFLADAAHELRSPLTALSLQAERLTEADMSGPARERLSALRRGIERSRNLLDQLLSLARAQSSPQPVASPISIQAVYRRVLEDLLPLAEAKQIDLGIEGEQDAMVWVNELDLIALVRNLVDNAIRYSPNNGRIDLSVTRTEGRAVMRIVDTGPGIQLAERKRVFDPFYRTLGSEQIGSGLGLSIVKAITDRIDAHVSLAFGDEVNRSGLCVLVTISAVR